MKVWQGAYRKDRFDIRGPKFRNQHRHGIGQLPAKSGKEHNCIKFTGTLILNDPHNLFEIKGGISIILDGRVDRPVVHPCLFWDNTELLHRVGVSIYRNRRNTVDLTADVVIVKMVYDPRSAPSKSDCKYSHSVLVRSFLCDLSFITSRFRENFLKA